jgi:hypothetical protein
MQEERARGKSTLALENPRIRVAIRAGQSYIAPQAALAQLVRALDCGSRGPPFEPGRRYHHSIRIAPKFQGRGLDILHMKTTLGLSLSEGVPPKAEKSLTQLRRFRRN